MLAPGVLSVVFGGVSVLHPALSVVAVIFFLCLVYFAYARHAFSPRGKDLQAKMQHLLLERIGRWDGVGKVLDIGCGNGSVTIKIAKSYPQAEVVGVDPWGRGWEYSKGVCQRNAEIEGVAGRTAFERASASSLPFDEETFDIVVSNLVFHEVRDTRDKRRLINEALRVVKKGGWFAFQDLFLWKRVYGETGELLETIKSWGIETVEFVNTSDSDFIPRVLKLPFMLGTVGLLHGRK